MFLSSPDSASDVMSAAAAAAAVAVAVAVATVLMHYFKLHLTNETEEKQQN
jgi:hypothetical protein